MILRVKYTILNMMFTKFKAAYLRLLRQGLYCDVKKLFFYKIPLKLVTPNRLELQ